MVCGVSDVEDISLQTPYQISHSGTGTTLPHVEDSEEQYPIACNGRYHHTSLYEPSMGLLWLYGGRDLSGTLCRHVVAVNLTSSEVVFLDALSTTEPARRFLHSAVLDQVN